MESGIVYIIGGVLAVVVFIFIARRVLRLAIKLVFVGVVILALLAGAGYGWWNGWFDSSPTKPQRRSAPVR